MGKLRVGVTTGIYMAAHSEELATVVRKIGYAFTRGTDSIELAGDVPHEVNHTDGIEIRRIAEHQGLTLTFHGSLTTPMTVAERSDWRDAHNHMEKSVRSAVQAGCKYCLFHACQHYWFELLSYTSGKLEILMCDFNGKPLSEILYKDKSGELQDWWIEYSWNTEYQYNVLMLSDEERNEVSARINAEYGPDWTEREITQRIRENPKIMGKIIDVFLKDELERQRSSGVSETEIQKNLPKIKKEVDKYIRQERLYNFIQQHTKVYNAIKDEYEYIRHEVSEKAGLDSSAHQKRAIKDKAREKMNKPERWQRKWNVENRGKYTDAYNLLAHWLFFNKDPMWEAFVKVYPETLKKYKYKPDDPKWLDRALDQTEEANERDFKEFYYAVVGAKVVEGHMKRLFEWMKNDYPGSLIHELKQHKEDGEELVKIAKDLKITIEIPDARDPKQAGLFILWRPKQLYALVKTLRKTVNKDIYITWDFEHLAGQGVDPIQEMEETIDVLGLKDIGKYTLSVHCNKPNPLHGHVPIELGDEEVYRLLWNCRRTGMGKEEHDVFLFFERGGGQDPFKQSVDALKLMRRELEKDTRYDKLPPYVYGLEMSAGDIERQKQIVLQHRFELVKELMQVPEEEWGWLSGLATRKGKTKEWKKNELGGL